MKIDMSNRELLVYYFSGALEDYLDYLKPKGATNKYRSDTIRFICDVKDRLDPFKQKLTPELKDMYKLKYREKEAFGEFYNVVAPTNYIVALNNELNTIVSKIERPHARLYNE